MCTQYTYFDRLTRRQTGSTKTDIGVVNGKSETCRDAETGILKSEPETKKCSDLIEKHICD